MKTLKLPKVLSVNTRATVLEVGNQELKVVKNMTKAVWCRANARMGQPSAVWTCEALGVNRVSRLEMEWHLLVANGNELEQWEHQRSLEEWSLKVAPRAQRKEQPLKKKVSKRRARR